MATNPQKPRQINVFAWPNPVLKVGRKWPNGQIWPNNCEFFVNFYLFGQIKVAKWPNPKNKSGHKIRPDRPQTAKYDRSKSVQTVSLPRIYPNFPSNFNHFLMFLTHYQPSYREFPVFLDDLQQCLRS